MFVKPQNIIKTLIKTSNILENIIDTNEFSLIHNNSLWYLKLWIDGNY